jgi:hypothetical protein
MHKRCDFLGARSAVTDAEALVQPGVNDASAGTLALMSAAARDARDEKLV